MFSQPELWGDPDTLQTWNLRCHRHHEGGELWVHQELQKPLKLPWSHPVCWDLVPSPVSCALDAAQTSGQPNTDIYHGQTVHRSRADVR
ncbi:hypothetical protein Nmel_012183 [Mimus melanotis]